MNISPKCAVELLEVIKYLDNDLKKSIPEKFEEYLNSIKDNDYEFQIDKNINLFDNSFMDETVSVLYSIFKDIL